MMGTKVKWLLYGSLALNLLLIGVLGGSALRGDKHPRGVDLSFGPYSRALDPEDRRAIGKAVRDHIRDRGGMRLGREEREAQVQALVAALQADPFDRAAVEAQFTQQRETMAQAVTVSQSALLDRIEAMTPEQRAAFVERLQGDFHDRREMRRKH